MGREGAFVVRDDVLWENVGRRQGRGGGAEVRRMGSGGGEGGGG